MTALAIGSARIRWELIKQYPGAEPRRMLIIDAPKAATRARKHEQVMLSEYQVRHLRTWLDQTQGSLLDGT